MIYDISGKLLTHLAIYVPYTLNVIAMEDCVIEMLVVLEKNVISELLSFLPIN